MSSNPHQIPPDIEQDRTGGDNLPTYDDLAQQSGPNSRFGRWREWIEKRAAERYADVTPEERTRRRERGWDEPSLQRSSSGRSTRSMFERSDRARALHVQTVFDQTLPPSSQTAVPSTATTSLPLIAQTLDPTHLQITQFGSRFLPHTMSPIRCLLPLSSDRLLLIGHDDGLSVLNMFPNETTEEGDVLQKGPDEAQARLIWEGEGVFQMNILEEDDGETGHQGVVLALVGPSSGYSPFSKESESPRSIRMYSLTSLVALANWVLAQPTGYRPLDMRSTQLGNQQSPKKHRSQGSLTRSLKSIIDPSSASSSLPPEITPYLEVMSPASPSGSTSTLLLHPNHNVKHQNSTDSGWDIVDEQGLRLAMDFVPLASPGSRLVGLSVRCYALWRDESTDTRGDAALAVGTKSNIWLYETRRGERAFRFVKDFYTPMQPRHITFIQQSAQEILHKPSDTLGIPPRFLQGSNANSMPLRCSPSPLKPSTPASTSSILSAPPSTQRSLFVIFDKKAGTIRLSDAVVGEIELCEGGLADLYHMRDALLVPSPSGIRSRRSSLGYTHKGLWISPVRIHLPSPPEHAAANGNGNRPTVTRSLYLLTRGKQTHLMPCPLPTNVSACPAFRVLYWESIPTSVTARVCLPPSPNPADLQPIIQVIGLGEGGVEVQEISLTSWGKGKGRARTGDVVRSQVDLGADAGYLCHGGRWDDPNRELACHLSSPLGTFTSEETLTSHVGLPPTSGEGIYGWCRKGHQDWRVFWLGGSLETGSQHAI